VIDNDYANWSALDNHYWPALYFVDADGIIRDHHFGIGAYELPVAAVSATSRRRTDRR
jgi:hypothetical protein